MLKEKDGRIFKLDIDNKIAREYNGRSVEIYAKAIAADNLETLKVKEIKDYIPSNVVLPDFQFKRKPLSIISIDGSIYSLRNIR